MWIVFIIAGFTIVKLFLSTFFTLQSHCYSSYDYIEKVDG